jgi:DUF438 domain-containing protein
MNEVRIPLEHGSLRVAELVAAFSAVPSDITFVDADGVVRYYSTYRIFSRTPACLDRDVLECHSERTRPGIARMLSEFANGRSSEVTFVSRKDGRDVTVRYLAVHGETGDYLGCLEIAHWAGHVDALA